MAKDTVQVVKEEHKHKDLVSLEASPDIDAEEVEQTALNIAHLPVPPSTPTHAPKKRLAGQA